MTTDKEPVPATQVADRIDRLIKDVKILAAHSAALEDAIYHADWRAAEKSRCELPEHLRMLMQDGEK